MSDKPSISVPSLSDAEVVARIAQGRLPSPIPIRPQRDPRLLPALVLLVVVAAVGFVLLARRGGVPAAHPAHGDVALIVEREGSEAPRRLADGDEVHPGDHLRLEVRAPQSGHMAIVSLDGRGATVRHPFASATPALYDPARPAVPGSLVLDDTLGVERLYLVYAREPFSLDEASRALASGSPLPRSLSTASVYVVKTR